jgi:hypothetical protein
MMHEGQVRRLPILLAPLWWTSRRGIGGTCSEELLDRKSGAVKGFGVRRETGKE